MKNTIKIKLFAFLVLALSFTPAFAQKPSTALEMNNYFTSMIDSLYHKGYNWGATFSEDDSSGNYSNLVPLRKDLESTCDRFAKELATAKDIGGSTDFKNAMIEFMHFEKNLITNCFKPFEDLSPSSTLEQKTKLQTKLQTDSKEEDQKLDKIRKIQKIYADKNGFVIAQ